MEKLTESFESLLNKSGDNFTISKADSTNRNNAQHLEKPAKLFGKPLNKSEGDFTISEAYSTNRNDAQHLEKFAKFSDYSATLREVTGI